MGIIFEKRGYSAADCILSYEQFSPFLEKGEKTYELSKILSRYGNQFIRQAEEILDTPYPVLDATVYMQFARNGNRSNYESLYFERRNMTICFALAELAERKGRFTDRIIDGIWHILEESTWILPAHNATNKNNNGTPLPDAFFTGEEDDDVKHIDLFSASTGGVMAWLWYILGDILDPETPVIRRRMLSQLKQRILHPFYTYDHDWWMGADGGRLNNWTPWIISNVLTAASLCEDDIKLRELCAEKSMIILDLFTKDYSSDGGCDEGPGYWGVAGASYYDCAELLYDMSGGAIDIFDEPLLGKMCEYIMNFSITKTTYINFADASSHNSLDFRMISRMGRRLGNQRLEGFAASLVRSEDTIGIHRDTSYRFFRDMLEDIPEKREFIPNEKIWYDGLQVAITHDPVSDMFLALKGGNNNESHNHNDVGQFILFDHSEPVILDAGVEQYCKDTFSSKRYTLWAMRAAYHNIPEINGVEQCAGGRYHAEVVSYDNDSGCLTLELKNAYPDEAGVESYMRSAQLTCDIATVCDKLKLKTAGEASFHYIVADKPELGVGEIKLATGHIISFDPSLIPSVDEIDLKNGKISREWKRDHLYRITLTSPKIIEANYVMTICQGH